MRAFPCAFRRFAGLGLVMISLPLQTAVANENEPPDAAAEVAFGAYYYRAPGYRPPPTASQAYAPEPRRLSNWSTGYRWRQPYGRYAQANGYGPRPYERPIVVGRYDPRTGYIYQDSYQGFAERRPPYAWNDWRWRR